MCNGIEMPNFVETMRLKGMADEDIYFARRDRVLIAALHKQRAAGKPVLDTAAVKTLVDDLAPKQMGSV